MTTNATARVDEIRELLSEQPELDPFFVNRVLKLCRMHEELDETISDERHRLRAARREAERSIKKDTDHYHRLITRVHNQREEINRLQRRVDELEAS